ncbi:MAG TPA: hypothetical protein VK688_08860 [Gemmatimonadales bacterium]|nr:hypothetical protein [Gemmatimonadales bacterium]
MSARLAPPASPPAGPVLLEAYLVLGRRPGGDRLDGRVELLVSQLSAELSGCRWCIEAGRHRCRKALLPPEVLASLRHPEAASGLSERERAALVFADAVAQAAATDGLLPPAALIPTRRHFAEGEIVRLSILAAGEHLADCLAGRRGTDRGPSFPIVVRGLA